MRLELLLHRVRNPVTFDLLLRDLRVVVGDRVGELVEVAGQHLRFARAKREWGLLFPGLGRRPEIARLGGGDRGASARRLGDEGVVGVLGLGLLGLGVAVVHLDQGLTGCHVLAVGDEDRGHLARRQRLDHFDSASRLDLAVRDSDDVDASEIGPSYGADDKGADDQDQSQAHRRSRRFKDFQVGRKEPAVSDDGQFSGRDHCVSRRGLLDLDTFRPVRAFAVSSASLSEFMPLPVRSATPITARKALCRA